jgi:hypothetical protein
MIMKITFIPAGLTLAVLLNNSAFAQVPTLPEQFGPHQWTANVKVIDEGGNPIAGASVAFQYSIPAESNSGGQTFGEVEGITDANGTCSASHTDSSHGLSVAVEKSGYYSSQMGYQFYFDDKRRNPTFTAILKAVGRPIPMYAKSVTSVRFPVLNKAVGYDLMAGDWVAPYGKGINTDFLFSENHADAKSGYTFTVSFPNNGDGIQEFDAPALLQDATMGQSDLRSLHEAPAGGYQSQYIQTQGPDVNRNHYFRVRTVLDSNGDVKSALYGKIYGDFMQFCYYLNPTPNDRNVEFDPKHNLLGGLKSFEEVKNP